MADAPMTVVETEGFLRKTEPQTEREELVAFLGANPEAGKIVAETGGVRKVGWGLRRTRRRISPKPNATP